MVLLFDGASYHTSTSTLKVLKDHQVPVCFTGPHSYAACKYATTKHRCAHSSLYDWGGPLCLRILSDNGFSQTVPQMLGASLLETYDLSGNHIDLSGFTCPKPGVCDVSGQTGSSCFVKVA